jgi:hypothetical protein
MTPIKVAQIGGIADQPGRHQRRSDLRIDLWRPQGDSNHCYRREREVTAFSAALSEGLHRCRRSSRRLAQSDSRRVSCGH